MRRLGKPLTSTSANTSGQPPTKDAGQITADLGETIALVVKGQCGAHQAASTVVDFTQRVPTILRQGAISYEDVKAALPAIEPMSADNRLS
jgi:L-threonylcarbamoyladenylate synthase